MATVRVHQDLYNFEVKRKGFTKRQIGSFVLGIAACAGVAMLATGLGCNWRIAGILGFVALIPVILAGFMPVWGMPFEEALARWLALKSRGSSLTLKQESAEIEKGVLSRAAKKKRKARGYECQCARETRKRTRALRKDARKSK